jgi:hypothetical protein
VSTRARSATLAAVVLVVLTVPADALAQPWVPPQGTGEVTIGFQRIDHTGHRVSDGTLVVNGASLDMSVYVSMTYGLTSRLVVSAALPYVFGKYTDAAPPPPFIPFLPIDSCRCWNSGLQDFFVGAGYNVVTGSFALTPTVAFVAPSRSYVTRGEAVIGRNLRELRLGVAAGQRLDAITSHLSVQGDYIYSAVERILDIPNNRSNASLGVAYRIGQNLFAEGVVAWQRTHGGLRTGAPALYPLVGFGEVNTPERVEQHDRLLRDNSTHAGGAVRYQFPRFDVFASYQAFVDGTDTHAGRAFTTGVSFPFER